MRAYTLQHRSSNKGRATHFSACKLGGWGWPALFRTWYRNLLFALRPRKRGGLLGTRTGEGGRAGRKSEGSTSDTARKRPERPWTAARTMEMLRRYLLAIAQRLVHCAVAVSTAVFGRVIKTMSIALLLTKNRDLMMNWCLMSSDVMRHIRDKLWPMPKHGAINLYVHGNQKAR